MRKIWFTHTHTYIFLTKGPLVEQLAEDKTYVAGTIKERTVRFPDNLKKVRSYRR